MKMKARMNNSKQILNVSKILSKRDKMKKERAMVCYRIDRPTNANIIGSRWVFTDKFDASGS